MATLSRVWLVSDSARDSCNLKSHKYVCITAYEPDTHPSHNTNPNPDLYYTQPRFALVIHVIAWINPCNYMDYYSFTDHKGTTMRQTHINKNINTLSPKTWKHKSTADWKQDAESLGDGRSFIMKKVFDDRCRCDDNSGSSVPTVAGSLAPLPVNIVVGRQPSVLSAPPQMHTSRRMSSASDNDRQPVRRIQSTSGHVLQPQRMQLYLSASALDSPSKCRHGVCCLSVTVTAKRRRNTCAYTSREIYFSLCQ